MSKSIVKLFRDPQSATKALKELKSKGFKADEIGVLVRDGERAKKVGAKATKDIGAALAKIEGLSTEAIKYFENAASVGAILVSVSADEKRLADARQIMREADFAGVPNKFDMWSASPGFPKAEKMSATNPVDAKMTGDFRRY